MADSLRITVDELRRRMEAGEDFVLIRSQSSRLGRIRLHAARSDSSADGQARRKPSQNPQEQTCSSVLHLTRRGLQRQFGAETSGKGSPELVGSQGGFQAWQKAGLPVAPKRQAA
jgi:hypothetical protein